MRTTEYKPFSIDFELIDWSFLGENPKRNRRNSLPSDRSGNVVKAADLKPHHGFDMQILGDVKEVRPDTRFGLVASPRDFNLCRRATFINSFTYCRDSYFFTAPWR